MKALNDWILIPIHKVINWVKNPFLIGEKLAHLLLPRIQEHQYDFILTSSDRIAQGMAAVLDEAGLKIPQDINLLGFDKINSLPYFKHNLPTIEVPIQL